MYSLTIWAITIIRAILLEAEYIFRHSLPALSAVFSGNTYIFSKERFLLLWILPFLLRFLFHAFKEQSRLRSGRKCAISIQTNPKTESVSERQESAERLVLPMGKWCKAATPRQIELNQRNLKKLPKRISLMHRQPQIWMAAMCHQKQSGFIKYSSDLMEETEKVTLFLTNLM